MRLQHIRLFLVIFLATGLAAVSLVAASAAQATRTPAAVAPSSAALLDDPELVMRVNYAHEWVEGDYEIGHTIWLTLTNSSGDLKATASGITAAIPGWGGGSGFSTNENLAWSNTKPPDIQAGDWLYGKVDNGKTGSIQIGEIEGQVDAANDEVAIQVHAPWFEQALHGDCYVWVESGPGQDFQIEPDGGSHTCDFSGEWNIIPGQDIGVSYQEPDGDRVYNVFQAAAPHLWVDIWGDGEAAEGSNYVLSIAYNNDGAVPAADITISQTLKSGMIYLEDTSGVTPTGTGAPGNPLVWHLGDLPAVKDRNHRFEVFVLVMAAEGEPLETTVQIQTATEYFQGDADQLRRAWESTVVANQTQLNIGINSWTWDPAPGEDYVYGVNICNNGSTASSDVVVNINLPPLTTLVSWWGQEPGWLEDVKDLFYLAVRRPSLPGFRCSEVYLQVRLDENALIDADLVTMASVYAANDLLADDNHALLMHKVGSPHTNLSIHKDWASGQLVPGSELNYEFSYANSGNIPVEDVVITQTLPAGVTFQSAYQNTPEGRMPLVPFLVTPEQVVWKDPVILNGYWKSIGVTVRIDSDTAPGALLASSVEVVALPLEDRYDDNQIEWTDQVNDLGPNLRVDKSNYRWEWDGADRYDLNYELRILNLGTEVLENVWIEDVYPAQTDFTGDWWVGHGPGITMTHETEDNLVRFWVERLHPGETASLNIKFTVKPEFAGEKGLVFTNVVEAPWEGDVFPADNHQEVTAYSGPDAYIRKTLTGGIPKPGEIITFTVEFGNSNQWPWEGDPSYGSHITETLPAGMTFIAATTPWDPEEPWIPMKIVENQVVWEFGTLWPDGIWSFEITAQIRPDILGDQILVNQIEIFGDSPEDVEYDRDNNHFDLPVEVLGTPSLELTPVSLNGEAKPGKSVVYTFLVMNTGDLEDSFSLTVDSDWAAVFSKPNSGPLMPGEIAQFSLTVTIPATAQLDDQDVATVTAASDYDPKASAQASATTTSLKPDSIAFLAVIQKP